MPTRYELLTQQYSTFGDKLLQHCDRLAEIQEEREFSPITVQLAPIEACDSHCSFCSVEDRPLKSVMPFLDIAKCLDDFVDLGAKSLELTGGGNPMLYKHTPLTVNAIIRYASEECGLKVGIITNSETLERLDPACFEMVDWIRISLAKFDEGKTPWDYDLCGFPQEKVGWSYIVHEKTTPTTIEKLKYLLGRFPASKFVRIAGDCLHFGANKAVKEKYEPIISAIDVHGKCFIKETEGNEGPFNDGCYVGMIRPYVAPSPDGAGYFVYTCTSHTLHKRTYDKAYALCEVANIIPAWTAMNARFQREGFPYEVKGNQGRGWCGTCTHCFYGPNNKLLHTVAQEMPDKDFP